MPSELDHAWPSFGTERLEWTAGDSDYGPRRGRAARQGPYTAAVPPQITGLGLVLPPETVALVDDASAQIVRFDGETLGGSTMFAALLLRTEAASSSQIEHLTSSAKAIALAELGRTDRANATEIVANVAAMTTAVDDASIDSDGILAMHQALMSQHTPQHAGRWRAQQVWIGGSGMSPHGADYVAPHHDRVPAAMDDLAAFATRDDLPALPQAAIAHAQFENIHPFPDGNGRTGRALLHAMLRSTGLVRHSIVPVSAGLLGDTGSYFAALEAYRAGDVVPIVERIAEAAFPALANARRLIDEVRGAREAWAGRIRARRDSTTWRLADLVMTRPVVDAAFVARRLGVTAANAQIAIGRLVEAEVLSQIGHGARNRAWEAAAVLDAMEAFAERATLRSV